MEMDQVMQQMQTNMHKTNGIPTKPTIIHTKDGIPTDAESTGGLQDTPAASWSLQKANSPHSSKLLSLPVQTHLLSQMFPAPSPKYASE